MKPIYKMVAAACLAAGCGSAAAQGAMSLQQCIDYAQQHSIDIQKRRVAIEQQRNKLNTASHAWLPTVTSSLEGEAMPHYSTTNNEINYSEMPDNVAVYSAKLGVDAQMSLFNAGKLKNQKKAEQFSLEALTAQMDKARNDLRIQVACSYMNVLYNQGLADVSGRQVELSQELLDKATVLMNEGKRPQSEVATATSQLASCQSQWEKDKGNVLLCLVNLAQVMNMEDVDALQVADAALQEGTVPDNIVIPDAETTFSAIADRYPGVLAANAAANAAEYTTKAMRSGFYPEISLFASLGSSYGYTTNENLRPWLMNFGKQVWNNFGPVIGLRVSYTLFNGFATRNNVRNAKLSETAARLDFDNARMQLRQELQQAYYNAVTATGTYKAAVKSEEASRIDYDYRQKSYDAGRSTIFELDEARQKWVQAQNDAVQAKYQYLIRMKILDFYNGEF